MYTCCHRPTTEGGGCTQGPHVFYESDLASLHTRHPFSSQKPSSEGKKKERDVVALDCEMIYTTGGFRVARVSIVDARGQEIFDELVKMDDGVEVVCVAIPPTLRVAETASDSTHIATSTLASPASRRLNTRPKRDVLSVKYGVPSMSS